MAGSEDLFRVAVVDAQGESRAELGREDARAAEPRRRAPSDVGVARFEGFDIDDQPLIVGLIGRPYRVLRARTTVPLRRSHAGSPVVVAFEEGDPDRPIVLGVLQDGAVGPEDDRPGRHVRVEADDDRFVVEAEREIVLRCGDASITLTRAGKVIIRGAYVLSRSTGYNRIKGATVDIN